MPPARGSGIPMCGEGDDESLQVHGFGCTCFTAHEEVREMTDPNKMMTWLEWWKATTDARVKQQAAELPDDMYRVIWEVDIDAPTPLEAARKALEMQRDSESTATIFNVYRDGERVAGYDLSPGCGCPGA